MNWTCLVYGAPMMFVTIWWFVDARKWFTGPKVNVKHKMLGQNETLEGKDSSSDPSLHKTAYTEAGGDTKAPISEIPS